MTAYFVVLAALVGLVLPVQSQAYTVVPQPRRIVASPTYRGGVVRQNPPVIVSPAISRPISKRPQVVDHRTVGAAQADHTAHEGDSHGHSHNHDSVGVRQIIKAIVPFF